MPSQSSSDAHTTSGRKRPRLAAHLWLAAAPLARIASVRIKKLTVGTLTLWVALGIFAVAAFACEGTGGPPSAPPKSETVAQNPSNPGVQACYIGKSVDCASGNETEQQTDVSIGGRGPGLRIVRSYNALSAAEAKEPGPWGYGWTGSYDASIEVGTETVTIHQDNGSAVTFYKSGSEYTQGGWVQARLTKSGSSYIYTLPNQTKLEFNSEDHLVKETERSGNSNTLTYKEGKLEKVEDGDKRTLSFKYNGEGLVESVTDPMKHVVSYTYHEKQLASVTIEGKERWKFEYESPHLLTKVTDGRGHSTIIKYEKETRRVSEEELAKHVRKWKYGTNETTITEPNGSETVEVFNAAGEPTKITHAKGSGVETTSEYEYSGETYNLVKFIDGNKHEWKYGYDSEGNKTSETDPNKDEKKWSYDKKHDIETETTPEGEKTTYKLNSNGLPEAAERPVGSETQKSEYKYDAKGDLEEVINPLTNATKYTYDAAGDKETEKDPEGDERKWKYNEDSQVTEETSARGYTTTITRNEQGWPTKIEDPLKHTTEYKYDGNGNIESETDGNSHVTQYEYNEENLRTKVTEADGDTTETGYDSEGQMVSHTDGNKHTWEYKRNQLEQVTEEKNPLSKIWKKKYNKGGDLESVEDPEKHTTEYTYDESNRLTKVKYSTGKPSEMTYEYNKDGKITKMKDETGTTENTWDKLDRLTEYKNGAGKTVKYEYNLDNEPIKITYPNGKAIKREYDKAGRLSKVTDWNEQATSFKYDKDSDLISTVFPSETGDEDSYGYNEDDQVTEITYKGPGGSHLASLTYTRGKDGEVKKTITADLPGPGTSDDTYDEANRLVETEGVEGVGGYTDFEYDKANNPTKIQSFTTYKYNEADELTENSEGTKYAFNEDGQRTEAKPSKGPATTYSYNQAGDLTAVERPEEGELAKIEDSYTYDGTSLRQSQTHNGTTTHLTWDTIEGLPVILSDETNSYIYGPENLPIEQISASGETLYFHHDQQGSTRILTNTKGEPVAEYAYTSYGVLSAILGGLPTPLGYDGQYTNYDTGLIYLRNRVYDPTTAQFLTVDPVVAATGEPYSYTRDNPLNGVDPTGESWWNPFSWSQDTWTAINYVNGTVGAVLVGFALVPAVAAAAPWIGIAIGVTAVVSGVINVVGGIYQIQRGKVGLGAIQIGFGFVGGGVGIWRIGLTLWTRYGYAIAGPLLATFGWEAVGLGVEVEGVGISCLAQE